MASQMAILYRTRSLLTKSTNITTFKSISTFPFLNQEPELAEPVNPIPPNPSSLPPNPASGSPLYNENWRNPIPKPSSSNAVNPFGLFTRASLTDTYDSHALLNMFGDWMASQRWHDVKDLFEVWVRSLDKNGKPNKPDVNLFNHYLRANLMIGASAAELLDSLAQMEHFNVSPNTASFNLVLKAMHQAGETLAAEKLLERMLQSGNEALPDDESYDLVIGMLFSTAQIDAAFKYIDLTLKNGNVLSMNLFMNCVRSCVKQGRLDTLVAIIEKCRTTDQNKALCPSWNLCIFIAEVAIREDNSKLAYYALEFMARWIVKGELARPQVLLSVNEGLVVSALLTAGRTYNSELLGAAWAVLDRSLRKKKVPNPESYLGKIYALASLGKLQNAFGTLHDYECAYGDSNQEADDLFCPFTSLHPLVVACSKKGFETLDTVYFQLENLSRAERPYKSVAALNCVIVGCANIWDLDRAYQTFESIGSTFGLTPDIHSYNGLMYAFGKLKKTHEASKVFEHLVSLGVKPNAKSYSVLVDAHLINRDVKSALAVIDDMISAGFEPMRGTLKKVRRRCIRESDYESDQRLESLSRSSNYRLGSEARRNMLFNLDYSMEMA
ncbi:pentatricopeptide repeat-containing protein At1g26460, mitochondrial [Trifolium pratense]|uniref:pentatricopeptide repeat-containing protein At1g26460, mitochondrial n=1 Tax=Trifolium pratense TaxID=57577 RepID=UPI001E695795|nr:pentatricopeptide repeat-containing protein At1g26460, mitochondrial [Trifolium pratense]XP_045813468.1 pentatricopeptide repeat-containing protein At1g26460, mitochondrial [Trifolium pratense]XP_045813469.1 pentatricopeptide repeat-containing protein At1g26460, mitochondrial [Trifolium pratense]